MEPRIQYAQTKDGMSIAYWTMGEGEPMVYMPSIPFTHVQLEWRYPGRRGWYERLAQHRRIVRYDTRGSGLSERNVTGYSLDTLVLDLEAVVDRLRLDRFALFGVIHSGPVAIAYAARHPERVSHLILWCAWVQSSDWSRSSQMRALRSALQVDWETYTETMARVTFGWSEGELTQRYAEFMREGITQEAYQVALGAIREFDVTALLPQVTVPTLVLHRRQVSWLEVDVATRLAAGIPTARLALLEGTTPAPNLGDTEAVLQAIDEFLGESEKGTAAPGLAADDVHTILFTDVEGSTALTDRLGDAKARDLLREHERLVRDALKAHGGAEVKALGDGFMTSFSSASKALECAIAIQRAFAKRNAAISAHPEPVEGRAAEPILVRIGLNAGEPIAEDDDLFGTTVNLAARIAAQAEGGEILASEAVRQIVAGKKFPFSDRGETALRGFEDLVHIYQVSWREED